MKLENIDAETIKMLLLESLSDINSVTLVENLLFKRVHPSEPRTKYEEDKTEKKLKEDEALYFEQEDDPLMLMDDIFEIPSTNLQQEISQSQDDDQNGNTIEMKEEKDNNNEESNEDDDLERIKKLKEYQDIRIREGKIGVSLGALEVDQDNNA